MSCLLNILTPLLLYNIHLCLLIPLLAWSLFCLIWVWLHLLSVGYHILGESSSITLLLACLSLELRWVSWGKHILVGSCFSIHPAILCILIGEFNPFTFRVITDRWGLSTAIYLLFSGSQYLHCLFVLVFLSAILIWWLSIIFFCFLSFLCFVSILDFCFVVTTRFVIKPLTDKIVLFLLISFIFICLYRLHPFLLPLCFCCHRLPPFMLQVCYQIKVAIVIFNAFVPFNIYDIIL